MIQELPVRTGQREEILDVTDLVQRAVSASGHLAGIVYCFVPHTTAGITINENADPDVKRDILYKLGKEIPREDGYRHAEGNSDAHIKASLLGFSQQVFFENKRLVLGQWQGIQFCEFDGPRNRRLLVKVVALA
ncbi:MAG TPA: secondary thiamine-phosphate synthase enzyme YjbQ [Acidobacteriota bacterium]|nr:secondary thiamine-phosphate synthase enzyme YjbQ [Acidobacteriota bacterium]